MPEPCYGRYVALGDSQTEGLGDGNDVVGHRGWADRLAEHLTRLNPHLRYANLAVRGLRAGRVRAEQLQPALALHPDLVTVIAGMNDLIRPRFDAAAVAAHLEAMFAALSGSGGVRVATMTFPDISTIMPIGRYLRPRVVDLNARIRAAADRHGVTVLDTFHQPVTTDPRMWSPDRLHASALGHALIADGMALALGLPGTDGTWDRTLPPQPAGPTGWRQARAELSWMADSAAPWVWRVLRGRSTGDGRTAKRLDLGAISRHPGHGRPV